jgi:DNA processing protein
MGHDPIGLDELVARTGWSPAELNARLFDLELAGRVERLPGQRFQRLDRA